MGFEQIFKKPPETEGEENFRKSEALERDGVEGRAKSAQKKAAQKRTGGNESGAETDAHEVDLTEAFEEEVEGKQ